MTWRFPASFVRSQRATGHRVVIQYTVAEPRAVTLRPLGRSVESDEARNCTSNSGPINESFIPPSSLRGSAQHDNLRTYECCLRLAAKERGTHPLPGLNSKGFQVAVQGGGARTRHKDRKRYAYFGCRLRRARPRHQEQEHGSCECGRISRRSACCCAQGRRSTNLFQSPGSQRRAPFRLAKARDISRNICFPGPCSRRSIGRSHAARLAAVAGVLVGVRPAIEHAGQRTRSRARRRSGLESSTTPFATVFISWPLRIWRGVLRDGSQPLLFDLVPNRSRSEQFVGELHQILRIFLFEGARVRTIVSVFANALRKVMKVFSEQALLKSQGRRSPRSRRVFAFGPPGEFQVWQLRPRGLIDAKSKHCAGGIPAADRKTPTPSVKKSLHFRE